MNSLKQHLNRKNLYLALSLLCWIGIILFENIFSEQPLNSARIGLKIEPEKIKAHLLPLLALSLFYLLLFLIGLINLLHLAIKKDFFKTQEGPQNKFPLTSEKSTQLLFFVSAFSLIIYSLGFLVYLYKIKINPFAFVVLSNLLLEITIIVLIYLFLSQSLSLSFKKLDLLLVFKIYTAVIPLLLFFLILSEFILDKFGISPRINPAISLIFALKNKVLFSLFILQIILVGPLAEELFFRGFIYRWVRERLSFLKASILSSLFFAFLHKTPQEFLALSVLGVALCYLYEKTQNILTPVAFHILHNALTLSLLFFVKNLI